MENIKNQTATEMKYKTVMDDPNTEKYCFANQYEFMMYAKHCKDAGRTSGGLIWINDSSYQEHFKHGYDLFDRGQYEQALTEYMEALKVNPVGIGARFEICECYLKLRRLSDARRVLLDMQEYLIEASYVARFYRRMSFIAVEQRNYRLAVACLLFSMNYENTPYVAQELMYIQSINGHPVKVSNPQRVIQSAGIPILKVFLSNNMNRLAKTLDFEKEYQPIKGDDYYDDKKSCFCDSWRADDHSRRVLFLYPGGDINGDPVCAGNCHDR